MIVSIGTEKAFDKIKISSGQKVPNKFGIDGYFLNLITSIYKNPRPNISMKYVNYSTGYVNSYWKQGKDVCSEQFFSILY